MAFGQSILAELADFSSYSINQDFVSEKGSELTPKGHGVVPTLLYAVIKLLLKIYFVTPLKSVLLRPLCLFLGLGAWLNAPAE